MRKAASLLGIVLLLALALMLLWRVHLHHEATEPDEPGDVLVAVEKIATPAA